MWRTIATVMIVIFGVVIIQTSVAGPLMNVQTSLNETGDYSNDHFNGNKILIDLPQTWFDMGLVAIWGIMMWGTWVVVRRELFGGRRGRP